MSHSTEGLGVAAAHGKCDTSDSNEKFINVHKCKD